MRQWMNIVEAAMLSESSKNDPHGSYGWWIFPDGSIQEMEEAGNHGWIDFPPTMAPVVRNALLRLVRETRHDFNEYFIGYNTVQAFDYRGIVQAIRGRP